MFACARREASFFKAGKDIAIKNNHHFYSDTHPGLLYLTHQSVPTKKHTPHGF
jgi:hypothetical protein